MLKLVTALVLLAGFAAAAPVIPIPSQPPPIQNQAASKANQPNDDLRGTQSRPLVVESHDAQQTQAEADQDPTYRQTKEANERSFFIGILQTILLGLTLMVTLAIAVQQLRAYVRVHQPSKMRITPTSVDGGFVVENCGATPAYKVANITRLQTKRASDPVPDPKSLRKKKTEVAAYLDRGGILTISNFDVNDISAEDEAGLARGDLRLYVWGQISYRSHFRTRYTWFSFWTSGPTWKSDSFRLSGTGNEST